MAQHQASVVLSLLTEGAYEVLNKSNEALHGIVIDAGPGSHTGTRVGVAFAKGLAFGKGWPVAAIESFDLISTLQVVSVSSRKGEFLVREPGKVPTVCEECPEGAIGWARGDVDPRYPSFQDSHEWLNDRRWLDAAEIVPAYYGEPLVSVPKKRLALDPL